MSNDPTFAYGSIDDASVEESLANFPEAAVNPFSFCCTPIELLSNDGTDTIISTASGFFFLINGHACLVTNWHVVSGRHFLTHKPLSPKSYVPQRIRYYGLQYLDIAGRGAIARPPITMTLTDDSMAVLSMPPIIRGKEVDIWVAPAAIGSLISKDSSRSGFNGASELTSFVNELVDETRVSSFAGDDCFILGYPLKNYEGMRTPIWKRGSLASDSNVSMNKSPAFLVDSAVTSSMSGSPVLRRFGYKSRISESGTIVETASYNLIGVYAGRLQRADLEQTNLGFAWYASLIEDVFHAYASTFVEKKA